MAKYGIYFALLVAGLLVILWRGPNDIVAPSASDERRKARLPRTYLEEARSASYDEQGRLMEIREADRIQHFASRDLSLLASPRYYSHNGSDKTWSASADRGRYRPSLRRMTLQGNVVLSNDASGARLETSSMRLELDERTARSKSRVTITRGDSITTADGIRADLEQERVIMGPNVETIYVRPE
jgi:lipopolysaccharide export system protein LptC